MKAKLMVFSAAVDPAVDLRRFPSFQNEYSSISSLNSYEWLSEGLDGPIPPYQNVIACDKSIEPPQSMASFVILTEVSEAVYNGAVYRGNVEQLSLKELCKDPDILLSTVQAQYSPHRVLLDSSTEENFHHLRTKAFGHAVLLELSTRTYPLTDDGIFFERTVLGQLCPKQSQYGLKLRLAEADLALQIIASSINLDPLILSVVLGRAASALPHPMWLLWDDSTSAALTTSPLMVCILAGPLPTALRETLKDLGE
ncbi:hypothetical protein Plhal304r1_c064g0152241 [Plasmopara halstedii]